jgi:transposase InsO family protein
MQTRSEALYWFKTFHEFVKNQFNTSIKHLRFDKAGEYTSQQFKEYLLQNGIVSEPIPTDTPQSKGKAERFNRTLIELLLTILIDSGLPTKLWANLLETANFLNNRSPHSRDFTSTPYEKWLGRKPNASIYKR